MKSAERSGTGRKKRRAGFRRSRRANGWQPSSGHRGSTSDRIRSVERRRARADKNRRGFSSLEIFEAFAEATSAPVVNLLEWAAGGLRVYRPVSLEERRGWWAENRERLNRERREAYPRERNKIRQQQLESYRRHRDSRLEKRRERYAASRPVPVRGHKEYAPYKCSVCSETGHDRRRCEG